MKTIEVSGKSYDEAVAKGLKELDCTIDRVEIETITEGKLLKSWKIKLTMLPGVNEIAENFVDGMLNKMGFEFAVQVKETADDLVIDIIGANTASIIGYRGEVLDSIQYLTSLVYNIKGGKKRIVVDTENYREKREKVLVQLAHNLESKVVRTQRMVKLEAMNPYERRVIHSALQESETVSTFSEGIAPNRYVIIALKGTEERIKAQADKFHDNKPDFKGNRNNNDRPNRDRSDSSDRRNDRSDRNDRRNERVEPIVVAKKDEKPQRKYSYSDYDQDGKLKQEAIDREAERELNQANAPQINSTVGKKEIKFAFSSDKKKRR